MIFLKFEVLLEDEFKQFAQNHEQSSFHQTINWGKVKSTTGWKSHLVGVKKDNKIIAASLLLSKKTPIKKNMFYAPRGFLIDYDDINLLTFFTNEIKKYVKKNKGIFIKIDPYISYQERDLNGNIVENGKNNKNAYNNLLKLGYKHHGFNIHGEELQPRWIFITPTKDITIEEIMKNMDSKTRQILRKNDRNKIKIREISYDELDDFKHIMQHTGDRRGFVDRPLSYYQKMYQEMHDDGLLKILIAQINTDETISSYNDEINIINKEIKDREIEFNKNPEKVNKNKYEQKQNQANNEILRIQKNIEHIKELENKHGKVITLGGILFYINNMEVLSSVGGSYKEFMEFQSAYTLHFAGMKYAIEHNLPRYNFYGITGVFDENDPLFGLYSFKRDFGGKVVELIGEFDLVIDKPSWLLYKSAIKTYNFIKSMKIRLKNKKL